MYFPTGTARILSAEPSCRTGLPYPIISVAVSPHKYSFATLTKDALWLWRGRPPIVLAHMTRSQASLLEHGTNAHVTWSVDASRLIIQTTQSYLILIVLHLSPSSSESTPKLSVAAQRQFQPGPGEGLHQNTSLHIEGIIRIEGNLLSVSPRNRHIYFSTKSPPAIQRIPWPSLEENGLPEDDNKGAGHDTWLLNDQDFPWLRTVDVTIDNIMYSPNTRGETWITSDGRVYFTYILDEGETKRSISGSAADPSIERIQTASAPRWDGTCIYDVREKRSMLHSQNHSDHPTLDGATCSSINSIFSLIAVGTRKGTIEIANFPSHSGVSPRVETFSPPLPHLHTGEVRCVSWSSDGYALAVGWENGWSVWSVGGRCLVWALGAENSVHNTRFQDCFMHGVVEMIWMPGNYELVALAKPIDSDGEFIFRCIYCLIFPSQSIIFNPFRQKCCRRTTYTR